MAAIGLYLEKISYLSTSEVIEQKKGFSETLMEMPSFL